MVTNRLLNILLIPVILLLFFQTGLSQNISDANKLRLAKTFEARGQLEEAEKIYVELHSNLPVNYQYYRSLYTILVSQKKYEEAVKLVEHQIEISKSKVGLYGDLGSVHYLMGNEASAMDAWDFALELEPDNAFAYRTIANYLVEHRLIDKAVEVLHKGNEASDDKTIFSYDIANFYSITMKFEEATKEYCKILRQKPKQLNLIKNKITGYINSNQATDVTLNVVSDIYDEQDNIIFLRLLSDLYASTNKWDKALESIIEIDKKTSDNGSEIFVFAQKAERGNNFLIASKAFDLVIQDHSNSALLSEAEIGYSRSMENYLNSKSAGNMSWKPLSFNNSEYQDEYVNLLESYNKLVIKYPRNKIGWEAEFRMGKIYFDNLNKVESADSIFNKILDETKSLHYIEESKYYLAQIFVRNGDLLSSTKLLKEVIKNRRTNSKLRFESQYLLAKILMWKGEFTNSITEFKEIIGNPQEEFVNDALQYSLILNTFKNDSTNLFSFVNADYLVEKRNFEGALTKFREIADNKSLFLLKDYAAVRYAELLIALNNYKEAGIFLYGISKSDENNIYLDRFLYLLGSNYYYGLENLNEAVGPLNKILSQFPNSIYYSKAVKIIYEINERVGTTL